VPAVGRINPGAEMARRVERMLLRMKMLLLIAALAMAGCSKKSDAGSAQAGGAGACGDAIAKAVGAMPGGPGAGDVQAKLKTILTTRCTEDKWPAAVVDCYATKATDMASMKQCRELLPPDQQQAVMGEIRAVMMGAGGAGPMHGAGGPAAPGGPGAGTETK